jgi:hypothetical protein
MREFKSQFGFLTFAQNTNVDYLNLAYVQAQNIKATQKQNQYAVVIDTNTAKLVTDQHLRVFDYVIELPVDMAENSTWKLSNEWQAFNLTPFKETIKLESDLLFTRDIGHWIHALRLRDICFSLHCRDHQDHTVTRSPYRKLFEINDLPDIYNGMYYFRYSQTAAEFFKIAKAIYTNWNVVKDQLIQCDQLPTTDVVFALTVKILGQEQCLIPTLDFFNFVHMKSGIQGWNDRQPWTDYVNIERDNNILRINNINQYNPVHYYEKNFNDNI